MIAMGFLGTLIRKKLLKIDENNFRSASLSHSLY